MENPGNGNPYIDIGSGWGGTPGAAAKNIVIDVVNGSPSGTTSIPYGIRVKDTTALEIRSGCNLGVLGTPTSHHELTGTGNVGPIIRENRNAFGDAFPWVRVNNGMRLDATPYADWSGTFTKTLDVHKVSSGSTSPQLALATAQGAFTAISTSTTEARRTSPTSHSTERMLCPLTRR